MKRDLGPRSGAGLDKSHRPDANLAVEREHEAVPNCASRTFIKGAGNP